MQSLHFVTKEAKAKKKPRIMGVITNEQNQLVSEDQKRMQDVTPTILPLFSKSHHNHREKTLNTKHGLPAHKYT